VLNGPRSPTHPRQIGQVRWSAAAALSMESRIDSMFSELNGDAQRFQELYYNER